MEGRVRFTQEQVASAYNYPLTTTLLTATSEGTAQTLGVVRSDSVGRLLRLAVNNQGMVAANFTFYAIPADGTIGAANQELTARPITAGAAEDLSGIVAGLYAPGTVFKAFCSVGSTLLVSGFIEGQL